MHSHQGKHEVLNTSACAKNVYLRVCVAPMHCVCGQVCLMYEMSVLAVDMFCVYVCVYLRMCEGLPAQGIGWIVSTCVLIRCAGWVRGTWVCVWVEGGSGFITPSTAFGPLNVKLNFPRLPAHTSTHFLCGHNAWKHGKTQLVTDTM